MSDIDEMLRRMNDTGYFGQVDEGFIDNLINRVKNGADNVLANNFGNGKAQGRLEVRQTTMALDKALKRWMGINNIKTLTQRDMNNFWASIGVKVPDASSPAPAPASNDQGNAKGTAASASSSSAAAPQGGQPAAGAAPTASPATPAQPAAPAAPAQGGEQAQAATGPLPPRLGRTLAAISKPNVRPNDLSAVADGIDQVMAASKPETKQAIVAKLKEIEAANPGRFDAHPNLKKLVSESVALNRHNLMDQMIDRDLSITEMMNAIDQMVTEDFDDLDAPLDKEEIKQQLLAAARHALNGGTPSGNSGNAGGNSGAGGASTGAEPAPQSGDEAPAAASAPKGEQGQDQDQSLHGVQSLMINHAKYEQDLRQAGIHDIDRENLREFMTKHGDLDSVKGGTELHQSSVLKTDQAYRMLFVLLKIMNNRGNQ